MLQSMADVFRCMYELRIRTAVRCGLEIVGIEEMGLYYYHHERQGKIT
jgi:hypothetical protein